MKSIMLIVGLFFWGMVSKSLGDLINVSVSFTQQFLWYAAYVMWLAALGIWIAGLVNSYRHRHDPVDDPEVLP